MKNWSYLFIFGLTVLASNSSYGVEQSPLSILSDAEQSYYFKVFDYTMDAVKSDEPYQWETYTAKGSIMAGKSFASKSKALCRKFTERFFINGKPGKSEGIACKRDGDNGWCRLKLTDAMTCAMESPAYLTNRGLGLRTPSFNGNINGPETGSMPNTNGINVNPGSPGNVEAPSGTDVADTVTGTAGKAGVSGAHWLSNWFSETFR